METIHITTVNAKDTKKDGTKLINKFGKPYFLVGIKTNEYGDTWLNGIMPFNPDRWEGTTQELEVFEEEYMGKVQKKFKLPPRNPQGMSEDDKRAVAKAQQTADSALAGYKWLKQELVNKGVIDLPSAKVAGTSLDYPKGPVSTAFDTPPIEAYSDADFQDINPEDIPFD